MGSCAAPSAKGDDKFITTDYLQQCPGNALKPSRLSVRFFPNSAASLSSPWRSSVGPVARSNRRSMPDRS
ncbi:hypothetical protein AM352_20750 [Citrobacter koseri]|nr:hypothetical protein AM352_20750 [Citrobacter koseri]AVU38250.1 hypothetical protein AM681_27230 [Serratia marcescens]QAR67922.1 hypothetical protein C3B53_25750 [Citrobacter sp. SL156]HAU5670268.1 hypothetical protein [Citrobacter freundii]AVU43276.1 hypothetical protein AS658_26590 [Serratia marcescens]